MSRHPLRSLLLGLLLSVGSAMTMAQTLSKLHADAPYFRDEAGRVVLLRGVNATGDAKVPPFTGIGSPDELAFLRQHGMNVVRLLFNWEAYEPTPGAYDQAYLDRFTQVVKWSSEQALYVIVDFHQDAFSRWSIGGCGEGFPRWAIATGIPQATPDNGRACANWGIRMLTDANLKKTWSAFYSGSNGARQRYEQMVRRVVTQLRGMPHVVGYDVMNEPGGTNQEISGMYATVGAAVREADPSAVLFFTPAAITSSGWSSDATVWPPFTNTVFAPHFYDPFALALRAWLGTRSSVYLDPMLNRAKARQAPMLLGEFGAPHGAWNAKAYMAQLYQWLDDRFVSATQWVYTPRWTPDRLDGWNHEDLSISAFGVLRADLFVPRAYPRVTAGEPVRFKRSATGFAYTWTHEPRLGETELYVPPSLGPSPRVSSSSKFVRCHWAEQLLRCNGSLAETVTVTVAGP